MLRSYFGIVCSHSWCVMPDVKPRTKSAPKKRRTLLEVSGSTVTSMEFPSFGLATQMARIFLRVPGCKVTISYVVL